MLVLLHRYTMIHGQQNIKTQSGDIFEHLSPLRRYAFSTGKFLTRFQAIGKPQVSRPSLPDNEDEGRQKCYTKFHSKIFRHSGSPCKTTYSTLNHNVRSFCTQFEENSSSVPVQLVALFTGIL
jgi:hypothetical protein